MITINLLPQEFRIQEKKVSKLPYMPVVLAIGTLFVCLTLYFYADYWSAKSKLAEINKEWQFVQPQSVRLQALQAEVDSKLKPLNVFLNSFVTADKPLTHMMSWTSEFLPPTSWLVEFKMERVGEGGRLYLKGLTLPSKEKSSIEFIETYLHDLKTKIPDANLSLTTSRQKIKAVEVTQFIATFEWGNPGAVKK